MRTCSQKSTGEHLEATEGASTPAIFHAVGSPSEAAVLTYPTPRLLDFPKADIDVPGMHGCFGPITEAGRSLDQLIGAAGPHFRIAKKAPISGAGDLISTTTESSMASNPWRTPLGCRQTSPGPMMNSSEPTVDFTLPFTT
jgi:hypothetical protein